MLATDHDTLAPHHRGPRHLRGDVVERRSYRGGTVEVVPLIPNRPRIRPSVEYRAIPARPGKSVMSFNREADARRWIDENEIGGNPNGFLHEIAGRRFRR